MPNLRDLRKRRKGAQNTRKITRTMELVSSAKLRKAQDAALAAKPYADGLRDLVLALGASAGSGNSHPLVQIRPVKTVMIAVATSDRGLCGAFNANLVALAIARAKDHEAQGRSVRFIALGKKAASTLGFFGRTVEQTHGKLVGATTYTRVEPVAQALIAAFLDHSFDLLEIVSSQFFTPTRQAPVAFTLLPAATAVADAAERRPLVATSRPDFIYEPDAETLLAALIPQTVKMALYSALLQTTASEHAARRIAMKNASDAAADIVKAITTAYNRGRQGKITQEIAEIVGAVEAMA